MADENSSRSAPGRPADAADAPQSQTPGHPSFRRQRASRACETCHTRKVRCDAASLGIPCTNCVAFSIDCRIPSPKRKKNQASKAKDSDSEKGESAAETSPGLHSLSTFPASRNTTVYNSQDGTPAATLSDEMAAHQATENTHYVQFMKPKFARAPITEAGRVAYLGESSNLSLLVHDRHGTTDVVHYPLPDTVRGSRARLNELDDIEINILNQRGAFLLPPRALCDELVDAFFTWVAPVVPIVNRSRFMRQYRDPKNPPSLLLIQAILLAGSRVCTNPQLMDANGSTTPAAMTFYKRAKALYDANYEDDRVTIVQALTLMGWYWEGPEDVTKNVFYWSRVATIVAQGSGMHRSVEGSQLSKADKRLWKRIWWTLFTRDRSVAVALGRPVHINTDDSDVEMVSEDDFIDDDGDEQSDYPADPVHVQFFLQYVKLCEIMGLVLSQQYSVASKARRTNLIDLQHSDVALGDWLSNCPKEVKWDSSRHSFLPALLHANYYTTLCLLHRAHMPPASSHMHGSRNGSSDEAAYPSRNIAFTAAGMITSIIEQLSEHEQLRFCPAFIVYSLFSALIMHVYQMRSSVPSIVAACQERLQVCMSALKEVSKVWLVAKMVQVLFESILGNQGMTDRMQKAAGKRHLKGINGNAQSGASKASEPPKRKFDDMELGFGNGPPAPQVSYERSRPQTPAHTPSRDISSAISNAQLPNMAAPMPPTSSNQMQSPHIRTNQGDAFMGGSRPETRPPTPFNPSFSMPTTPPDLFLVTRNSPNLAQSLFENFQPEQLFPENAGANMNAPMFSPGVPAQPVTSQQPTIDPQLANQTTLQSMTSPMANQVPPSLTPQQQQRNTLRQSNQSSPLQNLNNTVPQMSGFGWAGGQFDYQGMPPGGVDMSSPDETWSNSSKGAGAPVPTTLNVEDWFQFFGINNGELGSVGIDAT